MGRLILILMVMSLREQLINGETNTYINVLVMSPTAKHSNCFFKEISEIFLMMANITI